MGTKNNEVVIATTWNDKCASEVSQWIETLSPDEKTMFVSMVSPVNDMKTYFMGPNGSKKGWSEDDRYSKTRARFIEFIKSFDYEDGSSSFDFVEVGYGEYGQAILNGNCKNRLNSQEYYSE